MRSIRILLLLAMVPLLGCDSTGEWMRGQAAATAYATPLGNDTSVVTTRRVWSSTGYFLSLTTVMPDGAELATTDWKTGDPAVLDLASREFRRFRFNDVPYDKGVALQTVASPDGSQIMFMWYPNESEGELRGGDLRVVDVATEESRMIMAGDSATEESLWPLGWTPAGDSVFARMSPPPGPGGDVKVVLIPAAGGTSRLVHTIPQRGALDRMSPSPDGRWLLYAHELSRDRQIRSDIYIIDVQGGGGRPLVEHPAVDRLVGWLPGTDIVLFSSDRSGTTDLWSVRVTNGRASGEPRLVRSGFFRSEAVGFADGALFYRVETGSRGPAVINVDPQSGALRGPASPPVADLASVYYGALAWSPDGQALAAPNWGSGSRTITLHSIETGESRAFWLDEDVYPLALEWAADGKALLLRVGEAGWTAPTGPTHFLRLDLVTGTTTRLFAAADPEEPSPLTRFRVTPDGRSIVLRQQRTLDDDRTEMKLVLRSLEDGSERELHRTSGFIPEFSISADGTQLAFMQQVWEDSDSLFVMRMDGSRPPRAVASWNYDLVSLLGWLPGGNTLLAARLSDDAKAEEILRVELDGSTTVVGTSPFEPSRGSKVQGYYRSRLVLSPAGNRLAHNVYDSGAELWRMDGLHELFAEDATGHR